MAKMATKKLTAVVIVFEIILIILYGTMVKYDDGDVKTKGAQYRDAKEEDQMGITYTMFQVRMKQRERERERD